MSSIFLVDPTNALLNKLTVASQTIASATTVNGTGVDCANSEGAVFCHYITGSLGSSTSDLNVTLTLQESNDNAATDPYATCVGFTPVVFTGNTSLVNVSNWLVANDHSKRWVRLSITTTGTTVSLPIAAAIVATGKITGSGNGAYTGF